MEKKKKKKKKRKRFFVHIFLSRSCLRIPCANLSHDSPPNDFARTDLIFFFFNLTQNFLKFLNSQWKTSPLVLLARWKSKIPLSYIFSWDLFLSEKCEWSRHKDIFSNWIKFFDWNFLFCIEFRHICHDQDQSFADDVPIQLRPRHVSIIYSRDSVIQLFPRHVSIGLSDEFRTWRFSISSRTMNMRENKKKQKYQNLKVNTKKKKKTCSVSKRLRNIIFPRVRKYIWKKNRIRRLSSGAHLTMRSARTWVCGRNWSGPASSDTTLMKLWNGLLVVSWIVLSWVVLSLWVFWLELGVSGLGVIGRMWVRCVWVWCFSGLDLLGWVKVGWAWVGWGCVAGCRLCVCAELGFDWTGGAWIVCAWTWLYFACWMYLDWGVLGLGMFWTGYSSYFHSSSSNDVVHVMS